jgi:hypothetical protein
MVHRDAVFQAETALQHNSAEKLINFFCGGDFVRDGHEQALSYLPSALSPNLLKAESC